jgi:hypothetical protein
VLFPSRLLRLRVCQTLNSRLPPPLAVSRLAWPSVALPGQSWCVTCRGGVRGPAGAAMEPALVCVADSVCVQHSPSIHLCQGGWWGGQRERWGGQRGARAQLCQSRVSNGTELCVGH